MRKAQLRYSAAGTIRFRFPDGRPDAGTATVSVVRPSGTSLSPAVSGESATIDPASTSVSAWSSTSPDQVVVADSTGFIIERVYQIKNKYGQTADVEVIGISTELGVTTLILGELAPWDLDTDCTIYSCWVSYDLTGAQLLNPQAGYMATWLAEFDGTEIEHRSFFDVVRAVPYMVANQSGMHEHLGKLVAAWEISATSGGDGAWQPRLEDAFWQVLDDLDDIGLRAELLLNMHQLEKMTYAALLLKLAEENFTPGGSFEMEPLTWLKEVRARYQVEFDKVRRHLTQYDADDSGDADEGETAGVNVSAPLWVR
jgi:hypothetical protein